MSGQPDRRALDSWSGDPEELRGYADDLINDADLCERVFSSKHEAFAVGLDLAVSDDQLPSAGADS